MINERHAEMKTLSHRAPLKGPHYEKECSVMASCQGRQRVGFRSQCLQSGGLTRHTGVGIPRMG